jgi:hypothetical protein
MEQWAGIVAVLVVGIGLVVYGYLWDRTSNKLRREQLTSVPDRPIPGHPTDAGAPAYVQASDLAAKRAPAVTDPDALAAVQARTDAAPTLPYGHLAETFTTHAGGLCVLDNPVILVVDGELTTVRELLPIADYAKTSGRPLAVVAAAVTDDVLQTLEANALAGTLPGAAVAIPDAGQRRQFASLVGAVPITPVDLKSGWVPTQHLGACAAWVSSPTQLWVVADQTDAGQA